MTLNSLRQMKDKLSAEAPAVTKGESFVSVQPDSPLIPERTAGAANSTRVTA